MKKILISISINKIKLNDLNLYYDAKKKRIKAKI